MIAPLNFIPVQSALQKVDQSFEGAKGPAFLLIHNRLQLETPDGRFVGTGWLLLPAAQDKRLAGVLLVRLHKAWCSQLLKL